MVWATVRAPSCTPPWLLQGQRYDSRVSFSAYCLEDEKCYKLNVDDSFGDGLCCEFGQGSFQGFIDTELVRFVDGEGNVVDNFESFGETTTGNFCTVPPNNAPPTLSRTSTPMPNSG